MFGWLRRQTEELFGRSGAWPRVRREHLEREPACAACGRRDHVEVHHVIPFGPVRYRQRRARRVMAVAKTATTARCHLDAGLSRDQQVAGILACSLFGLLLAGGFAVLLTGCAKPGPEKPYTVRLIRPDGVVHATATVNCDHHPGVHSDRSGVAWVRNSGLYAPVGWLIEVQPLAEAQ